MGSFMPAPQLAALTTGRWPEKKLRFFLCEASERLSGVEAGELDAEAAGEKSMGWLGPVLM